ncbi:serine protease [Streptomyces sp. NPDC001848]|uniref:S1 family peptidase n=1 Tax=Streptomyces sp. NPDC001848 TaxID=3364618 RepID=UPI0036ADFEFE
MLEQPGLDALAQAATVEIGPVNQQACWGTGFFVAPGTVLTAAHVVAPLFRRDPEGICEVRGGLFNNGAPARMHLEQWLVTDPAVDRIPPEKDLALLQLWDEPVEHECVWLSDSASWYGRYVACYGHRASPDATEPWRWQARLEVNVRDGRYGVVFASSAQVPNGVAGGPLVDSNTGAVIGMLKARRANNDGGLGVLISALRRFGSTYQELMRAHDEWHGNRPLSGSVRNWVDEQHNLVAVDDRLSAGGDVWTPRDRRTALRLLAALPQPSDAITVASLARKAAQGWEWAGVTPELLCWRDGHGLLYEGATPRPCIEKAGQDH